MEHRASTLSGVRGAAGKVSSSRGEEGGGEGLGWDYSVCNGSQEGRDMQTLGLLSTLSTYG